MCEFGDGPSFLSPSGPGTSSSLGMGIATLEPVGSALWKWEVEGGGRHGDLDQGTQSLLFSFLSFFQMSLEMRQPLERARRAEN